MKLSYTNKYGEYVEMKVSSSEEAQDIINQNFIDGVEMSDISIEHDRVELLLKVFS